MLPPVTVTATRFEEDASRLPFAVSVITAEQLRESGATTVNDALMRLLGVPGRQDLYGGGDYQLDLRGFGSTSDANQVVILDGVRISEADLSGTRLAGISIDSVERIEVIRGGSAGVLYGEGGTGGAIVITTKAASGGVRTPAGQGYLAMGSHGLIDARGSATLVHGGFSLDASLDQRSTQGHRRNFAASIDGRSLAVQWRNDWLRVGARHAQDSLETGLAGALTAAQYEADPSQTNTPGARAGIDNQRNGVFASASLGNWQIAFDAGRRDKALDSVSTFPYAYHIDARNRSLRARHSASYGRVANTFIAGVDDDEWTRVVHGAFGSIAQQESRGVYVRDDVELHTGTVVSASVRRQGATKRVTGAPEIDQDFTAWTAGVAQPLGKGVSVYGNVGRSFRFPNVDEIGFTPVGVSLTPQSSRDAEAGVRLAWRGGRGDMRYYRNALRGEIGYDPGAPGPFGPGANVNFDPTLRQGVELDLQHALAAAWELRAQAAAREAKFTAGPYAGNRVSLAPRYTASVALDWKAGSGHRVGGSLNTVSSRSADFDNRCTMPAYTLGHLRYAYSTSQVELGVGVHNVADRKHYTVAYQCNAATGVPDAIYPEAGRTLVLSVRVTL